MKKFAVLLFMFIMIFTLIPPLAGGPGTTTAHAAGTLSPTSWTFSESGGMKTFSGSSVSDPDPVLTEYANWLSITRATAGGQVIDSWYVTCTVNTGAKRAATIYVSNGSPSTIIITQNPATYKVTYYANGGTGVPNYQTKKYDETLTLSSTKPTRTGFDFLGWSTSSAATSINYRPGGSYSTNASLNLYAVWGYTVTYSSGGEGVLRLPPDQGKIYGVPLTLTSLKPAWAGHTFKWWSDGIDVYYPGDTYSTNADLNLHAFWEIYTYDITYNANGGSGAPANQAKAYDATLTLKTGEPTRTGYDFLGWSKSSTAASPDPNYDPGDSYSTNADLNLYAVWKIKTYTVTYNSTFEGVLHLPLDQTKTYGIPLTISSLIPTCPGHTFMGWSDGIDVYGPGDLYTSNRSAALYAMWETVFYNVTYNANGGTGAPAGQIKTSGADLTLSSAWPDREGYDFMGWSTSSTATEPDQNYDPGDIYSADRDLDLYAIWQIKTYTITYSGEGVLHLPPNQTKTYGVPLTLSSAIPVRAGYIFKYWSDGIDAYNPGDRYTMDRNATLYAFWDFIPATSLTVLESTSLHTGSRFNLGSFCTYEPADALGPMTFTSSDTSVAAVAEDGWITAKSGGIATITVSIGGKTAVCTVTVVVGKGKYVGFEGNESSYDIGYLSVGTEHAGSIGAGNNVDIVELFSGNYSGNSYHTVIYHDSNGTDSLRLVKCQYVQIQELYYEPAVIGQGTLKEGCDSVNIRLAPIAYGNDTSTLNTTYTGRQIVAPETPDMPPATVDILKGSIKGDGNYDWYMIYDKYDINNDETVEKNIRFVSGQYFVPIGDLPGSEITDPDGGLYTGNWHACATCDKQISITVGTTIYSSYRACYDCPECRKEGACNRALGNTDLSTRIRDFNYVMSMLGTSTGDAIVKRAKYYLGHAYWNCVYHLDDSLSVNGVDNPDCSDLTEQNSVSSFRCNALTAQVYKDVLGKSILTGTAAEQYVLCAGWDGGTGNVIYSTRVETDENGVQSVNETKELDTGSLQAGDLVFWKEHTCPGCTRTLEIHHVGIFAGRGADGGLYVIDASSGQNRITFRVLWSLTKGPDYVVVCFARPLAASASALAEVSAYAEDYSTQPDDDLGS